MYLAVSYGAPWGLMVPVVAGCGVRGNGCHRWIILREHVNDTTFDAPYVHATFTLPLPGVGAHDLTPSEGPDHNQGHTQGRAGASTASTLSFVRYLRVVQTAPNSSGIWQVRERSVQR